MAEVYQEDRTDLQTPSPEEEAYIAFARLHGIGDTAGLLQAIREQEMPGGLFSSQLAQALKLSSPPHNPEASESNEIPVPSL